jgi:hypothetical protein
MVPRIAALLALLVLAAACGTSNQAKQVGQVKPDKATRDLVARTRTLLPKLQGAIASIGVGLPPVGAAHSAFAAAAPKRIQLAVRLESLSKQAWILARDIRRNRESGAKQFAQLLNAFARLFRFEAQQSRTLAAAMTTRQPNVRVFCNLNAQLADTQAQRAFFAEVRAADPNPRAFARAIRRLDALALDHVSACDELLDSLTRGRVAARQYMLFLPQLAAAARAVEPGAQKRAIHQALSLFLERVRVKMRTLDVFARTGDLTSSAQRTRLADCERTNREYHAVWCKVAPKVTKC